MNGLLNSLCFLSLLFVGETLLSFSRKKKILSPCLGPKHESKMVLNCAWGMPFTNIKVHHRFYCLNGKNFKQGGGVGRHQDACQFGPLLFAFPKVQSTHHCLGLWGTVIILSILSLFSEIEGPLMLVIQLISECIFLS